MADKPSKNSETSVTITVANDETDAHLQPEISRVRLKLKKPKAGKKVNWTEETVDNEHMDKKKSKCCCIYHKPRAPDESSSSEDEVECEHCHGHVEKKKKNSEDSPTPSREESSTTSMVVA